MHGLSVFFALAVHQQLFGFGHAVALTAAVCVRVHGARFGFATVTSAMVGMLGAGRMAHVQTPESCARVCPP